MAFQICAQANQDLLLFLFSKLHPSWMDWYFAWIAASFIITVHVLRHISDPLWTTYPFAHETKKLLQSARANIATSS